MSSTRSRAATLPALYCHALFIGLFRPGNLVAVAWLFSFASLSIAQPATAPLTFEAALDAARSRSESLRAQDAVARAAGDMAVSAARLPDPVLRLSVDALPVEGPMRYRISDDPMTQRSVEILQTFTDLAKRQARSARFDCEAEQAAKQHSAEEARLLAQSAQAWIDRYYQEQMLNVLQQQREEAVRASSAAEAAYRSGKGSQADVLLLHADVARIDDRILEARAELASATSLLQRWVGDVGQRVLASPPAFDRLRLAETHLAHEVDWHPDIAVMNARENVALAEAEMARQEKSADWSWSLMYSRRGDQFGDMVSLGVSLPLQREQSSKQERELAASLARVDQVRSEREEMRREHLFEVQRLLANWRSSLQRLENYDKTLLPLASGRVAAMEADFRGGAASLGAVLDARRGVIDTRLERLRIARQTALWWAELEFLAAPDQTASISQSSSSNQPHSSNQPFSSNQQTQEQTP